MDKSIKVGSKIVVSGMPEWYAYAEKVCTIDNPAYASALKYSPHKFIAVPKKLVYVEGNPDCFTVPRGFPLQDFDLDWSSKDSPEIVDLRIDCPAAFPEMSVDLYTSQRYVSSTVYKDRDSVSGGYLVVMPTSKGKSITALDLVRRLNQRVLIVVHLRTIFNGWLREINKVFGLPASKIGVIQGNTWRVGPCVTVAMLQTLTNRQERWPELFDVTGTLVVDEAHIVPCHTAANFVNECPARYRIGLTATEDRKDKLESVLYLLFGEPFVKQSIEMTETRSSLPISDAILLPTDFYAEYTEDYHAFLEALTKDVARNEMIVSKVVEEAKQNYVCLVVTNRREHAKMLHREIGRSVNCDLLLGGMDKTEFRLIMEKFLDGKGRVLVSTNKLISTGANIPPLERLFVTIPYANSVEIVQLAGRIRRKFPGKKDAVIYDFFDVNIPRVRQIFRQYHLPAFRRMRVPTWMNKHL